MQLSSTIGRVDPSKLTDNEILEEMKKWMVNSGKNIILHNCSFCKYPCGYLMINGKLHYDSGCDCVFNPPEPRDDSNLLKCIKPNRKWAEKIVADFFVPASNE